MTSPLCPPKALRRKAVWGPKRTLAAILIAAFGLSTNAIAGSGKGSSDWGYAWVPVIGPIIGGVVGAWVYVALWTA